MRWILIVGAMMVPSVASAGPFDPWFAFFKASRSATVVQTKGPYSDYYACEQVRYELPVGAVFLGCRQ